MQKVIARAPVRADLAGGTLDLWPLYLFHPGSRTVNVAISFYAESEVCETGDGAIEVHLTDQQYRQRYESMQELSADPKAALIHRALEHFHLSGISITTRTDAPRGSGLGGSSALTITLVRALSALAGRNSEGDDLIFLVRDLETRLLGVPAGIQDYYPPVYGGLAALHLNPGLPERRPISLPIADLSAHMLLHYTGVAHFSGTNNWELYKRQIDGKKKVQKGLSNIAATAIEMEKALETADFKRAGAALKQEWLHRKAMIDGISTPEIEQAIDAALAAGAWGGKVCGAGGGGCIVFLFPPDRREAIVEALGKVPGRVLDVAPVQHGLTVSRSEDAQPDVAVTRTRAASVRGEGGLEEFFVWGDQGSYRPFILAEGLLTLSEPRSGLHQNLNRSYVAPIERTDGRIIWQQARLVDPGKLDLRAIPDPGRIFDHEQLSRAVGENAALAQEAFGSFLEGSERLCVFHNPAYELFSEPGESRDAFVTRCLDEARRRVDDETERLESTFRRRMDQLKQRSEREQRDLDSSEEGIHDQHPQDVNVAWGQALYNITIGKPATATEAAPSARQGDYIDNIAQIQKAWDRELQALRDEFNATAREVEEITVGPSPKNIEVTRYMVLWAGEFPAER